MSEQGDDAVAATERSGRRPRSPAGTVRLAEVAAIAGVSDATVSRVLNRKYGVSVSTRKAVEKALRQVGYERPLKGEIVVILVPGLKTPIFAAMTWAIEQELTPHGLRAFLCPIVPGSVMERDYIEPMLDAGMVAAVFLSASNTLRNADPMARHLLEGRGIPYISVNGAFSDGQSPVISTDDWHAAELAVSHLYDLGHRRIGMCAGPAGNTPADRRIEGFVAAMDARGLNDAADYVVRHHFSVDGGRHAADELLARGVTAIVASSDDMALGAIRAAKRRGLEVPKDVSVVGYDDSYMLDFTDPPLTTVRQPVETLAENCVRTLVTMIQNRTVRATESFVDPELRLRGSTGPVPR
ncbi:LacI family DNA-binding transcriptional regulator [Isoptericola sp. NPDC060282]